MTPWHKILYIDKNKLWAELSLSYILFSLEREYNQAFILHVFIPYLSSTIGIHTKPWSLKIQHIIICSLIAFLCLKETYQALLMHRDKAASYRSKERKEGIIMLDCLWKTKPSFFRATAASKTFSTGTILGLASKKQSLQRKYNKTYFFIWPGKNLTPHHYWGFTALCGLSSVGKTEKKSSKPVS